MTDSQGEVISVGRHRVVCEPDLYAITFIGDVTADDAHGFHEINVLYKERHGYLMCLADAGQVGTMSAETRRVAAELSRSNVCPGATAIFGASLFARTLATLVLKAIALTQSNDSQIAFHKTEAEARAWLAEQRPRLEARRVPT